MFHGAEEEGYHKACQCAAEEGHQEQEGEIAQHHSVAEGNHGGADLPDVVSRRACDVLGATFSLTVNGGKVL